MSEDNFIKVNKILGKEPRIGIFSRSQIKSSLFIVVGVYIASGIFRWEMGTFLLISAWLVISWSLAIGNNPEDFLDLFLSSESVGKLDGFSPFNICSIVGNASPTIYPFGL